MNKSSLSLIAKIIVILLLPLLLFNYVDTQPTTIVNEDDDEKGTRSVAIVNEDMGYENETEEIVLGKEITKVLSEQTDYSWVVMNRSAAEEGFNQQEHDAILYLPSNFTKNIMSFTDDSPNKASINYVIQPNLEAKERQKLHREMANAKNEVNYEMSTIYWNYVSQQVAHIREDFDEILEKEIAFQNAMHAFYRPSSETLAGEIEQHINNLNRILEQTNRVDETSTNNANDVAEAESEIVQFTEALEAYKETQLDQQKLLGEFQTENQQSLQNELDKYNEALQDNVSKMEETLKEQSVVVVNHEKKLTKRFGTMEGKLKKSQDIVDRWRVYQKSKRNKQESYFEKITYDIIDEYTGQILNKWLEDADDEFDDSLDEFIAANEKASLIEPIAPEDTEIDPITFEELETSFETLNATIRNVKEQTEELELEEPIDWTEVDESLHVLSENIIEVIENEQHEEANEIIANWENYAEAWEKNYNKILDEIDDTSEWIVQQIEKKQDKIIKSKVLSDKRKEELEDKFNQVDNMENKTTTSLVTYSESLSIFQTVLNQRTNINKELIKDILNDDLMEERIDDLFKVNNSFANKLEQTFGVKNHSQTKQRDDKDSDNFMQLVEKTEANLNEFNDNVQSKISENESIINEMTEQARTIAEQIKDVNNEVYEWDEAPTLEQTDGQMVFQFQQGTASSLGNLADLVSTLGESQSDLTTDTEELQTQIVSVQDESDELNDLWSRNVATTEQVKDDVYDVLGNTVVDGQSNPYVYDYLANPVNVEGQVDGKVLSESEDRLPPVVLFMIILLSGLLIGFLTQHYSSNSMLIQSGLFILLNLAVGLIISIYGLSIYPLNDSQAIAWSAFTILLLMGCSNLIRAGLFINPFVGWLVSIVMIMFFMTPVLNIIVSEFSFNNPISNVYMGLLYGSSSSFVSTTVIMVFIIAIVSAFIYGLQAMRNNNKAEEPNEEKAS